MPARVVNVPPAPITSAAPPRPAPIAQGERLADLVAHELAQLPHVLPPRCEAEELFGEPERAEREGDEALHEPFGRKRELEGAAADVHHDGAAVPQLEVRERRAEREPRPFLPHQTAHPVA